MLPVSFELFRSSVFFPLPYLSNSSLFASPFQISHREPSHSSSLVHRSLAKSTLPDSKRGIEQLKTLWSPSWPPWSRRKTAQAQLPLVHSLLAHSTKMCREMCKNQQLFFFSPLCCNKKQTLNFSPKTKPNQTTLPFMQSSNVWPMSPHRT